MGMVNLIF